MKILLTLSYLGTNYHGFQVQPNKRSVQGELCRAFESLFGFPCAVTGCSRTDSGVHAERFCATVEPAEQDRRGDGWCAIPTGKLHRAVNVHLPADISVRGATRVGDDFHARYNVVSKRYVYRISDFPSRSPFLADRALELGHSLSDAQLDAMRAAAELFVGRHDFSGFMSAGSKITDAVRCVHDASVTRKDGGIIEFSVSADGFLYNMVRIMTGTLLDRAAGRLTDGDIRRAIENGDRRSAGFTAPPHGLYLSEVRYDREIDFSAE